MEGREFQLQCDITNVAPARNLAVRWYRGNGTFEPRVRGGESFFTQALPFLSGQGNLQVLVKLGVRSSTASTVMTPDGTQP